MLTRGSRSRSDLELAPRYWRITRGSQRIRCIDRTWRHDLTAPTMGG
jgi:hypothetical protein